MKPLSREVEQQVKALDAYRPRPITLELDADEQRKDASYRLHMAKHGYCNPDHPGDLELQARYIREAHELIASAERNEARARALRESAFHETLARTVTATAKVRDACRRVG